MFRKAITFIVVFGFLIIAYFIGLRVLSATCPEDTVIMSYYDPVDIPTMILDDKTRFTYTPDTILEKRVAYIKQDCRVGKFYIKTKAKLHDEMTFKQVTKKNFYIFIDAYQQSCGYCLQTVYSDPNG